MQHCTQKLSTDRNVQNMSPILVIYSPRLRHIYCIYNIINNNLTTIMPTRFTMISVITLLILATGLLIYTYTPTVTTPVTAAPDITNNSVAYTNSAQGLSLSHPLGFTANETYGYQGFGPEETIKGISFIIPSSYATGTNLSSDSYISIEQIPKISNCATANFLDPAGGSVPRTYVDNGVTYLIASSTGAAAGNKYEETVYVFPGKSVCYAVRYFIHYGVLENYSAGLVQEFNRASLITTFDTIRHSLVTMK